MMQSENNLNGDSHTSTDVSGVDSSSTSPAPETVESLGGAKNELPHDNKDSNPNPSNNHDHQDSTEHDTNESQVSIKTENVTTDPRELAVQQADQVLESLQGGDVFLNGFNLLQVIANPRGNPQDLTFSSPSYHGRYGSHHGLTSQSRHGPSHSRHGRGNSVSVLSTPQAFSSEDAAPSSTGQSSGTDLLHETYYQLESTLHHVTEQLEVLNMTLEEWSRKILEEDPYSAADDLPEAQLRELPVALQPNMATLNELQKYLKRSGVLAHKFRELQGVHKQMEEYRLSQQLDTSFRDSPTTTPAATSAAESVLLLKEEIPNVFWQDAQDLDLTQLETFQSLFFAEKRDMESLLKEDENDDAAALETCINSWLPLTNPDSLNPWLDKVEIALLEAVREQSHAFFEESIRFATLQEMIESLLEEVSSLQTTVDSLLRDCVRPMQTVPADHTEKQEWQAVVELLDSANELVRCKASISGYLSAADDLTALDQVYYGRQKLKQNNLTQLRALQGVTKQLDQYEQLIVTNLRDELVESFLDWNTRVSTSPTSYAAKSSSGSTNDTSRVRDIICALAKCNGLGKTVQAFNSRLQDVMRLTVRTVVAEFADSAPSGAAGMTFERFLECLDMTMEQLLALMTSAAAVDVFCVSEGFSFEDRIEEVNPDSNERIGVSSTNTPPRTPMANVVTAAAELSSKSISELLRLRKDALSLLRLDEMKHIWDKCVSFSDQVEKLTGYKASALRSTLLAQAKFFVERKHDSNMSALVAALDSERWIQCDVSTERQAALTRLCTGRTLHTRSADAEEALALEEKLQEVEVNGVRYKVVWSCLLLIEMVIGNLSASAHFTGSTSSIVGKVADLLRLFNSRTTQLVLGAKAIQSAARLKSINAKHLSLVTQCLGLIISILPNIRASLMAQLPTKQHRLLNDIDQIKKEYADHNEKVLNKFATIIGGIIEHHLAPKLPGTNFDARAEADERDEDGSVICCVFFEGISSNTKKMHHVLFTLLPPEHLQDVFSRIFAFVDHKIPTLFSLASQKPPASQGNSPQKAAPSFEFPQTDSGKQQMLLEAEAVTVNLNGLEGVQPWEFTLVNVLERTLEYRFNGGARSPSGKEQDSEAETDGTTIPSDTEDPNDDHEDQAHNTTEPSPTEANESNDKDVKEDPGIENAEEGESNSGKVAENGKVAETQEETLGSDEAAPDYPVEVTTL